MDETMDGRFPAGDLNLLVKQMLNYDIGQRLKQKQCIRSSVFQDVNRPMAILPIAIGECPSMQCFWSRSRQTGTQQTRMQASVDRLVRPSPFVPIANVANSEIHNHHSFWNTQIRPGNQISMKAIQVFGCAPTFSHFKI
jgi:hypothetical protein